MRGSGVKLHKLQGLMPRSVNMFRVIRSILSDVNTRNLFFFLILNMGFGFVELFCGIATNSLSMISDAVHMFFDCTGLIISLFASLISMWRPNERFGYGYGRAEVIGSFISCLTLLFIAFFILAEAIERAIDPPKVRHERLLVVSLFGLIVNLIGIVVFNHGGSHGHSHHQHSPHSVDISSGENGEGTIKSSHCRHGFSLINRGVLLHMVADTLGSVSVIISSFLMEQFGWTCADTVCSVLIALLIGFSVTPLIKECVYILMQRQPQDLDDLLPKCYQKVMQLVGVYSIQEPRFWTLNSKKYIGSIQLEVSRDVDCGYIITHTRNIFTSVGVHDMNVELNFIPLY